MKDNFDPKDRVPSPDDNVVSLPKNKIWTPGQKRGQVGPTATHPVQEAMAKEITTQKQIIKVLMVNLRYVSEKVLEATEQKKPEALEEAYQAAKQFRDDMKWVKEQPNG